jgi:hypothetical protein
MSIPEPLTVEEDILTFSITGSEKRIHTYIQMKDEKHESSEKDDETPQNVLIPCFEPKPK